MPRIEVLFGFVLLLGGLADSQIDTHDIYISDEKSDQAQSVQNKFEFASHRPPPTTGNTPTHPQAGQQRRRQASDQHRSSIKSNLSSRTGSPPKINVTALPPFKRSRQRTPTPTSVPSKSKQGKPDRNNPTFESKGTWESMKHKIVFGMKTGNGTIRDRFPVAAATWLQDVPNYFLVSDMKHHVQVNGKDVLVIDGVEHGKKLAKNLKYNRTVAKIKMAYGMGWRYSKYASFLHIYIVN
jgi:hypothetical protein